MIQNTATLRRTNPNTHSNHSYWKNLRDTRLSLVVLLSFNTFSISLNHTLYTDFAQQTRSPLEIFHSFTLFLWGLQFSCSLSALKTAKHQGTLSAATLQLKLTFKSLRFLSVQYQFDREAERISWSSFNQRSFRGCCSPHSPTQHRLFRYYIIESWRSAQNENLLKKLVFVCICDKVVLSAGEYLAVIKVIKKKVCVLVCDLELEKVKSPRQNILQVI